VVRVAAGKKARKNRKTGNQTGKKVMRSPRSGAECPTGAHPKNTGGKKGRSGPKPYPFKVLSKELVDDPVTQAAIRDILADPDHRHFAVTLKLMAGYAEGLPEQEITIKGETARTKLADLLAGISARKKAKRDPEQAD
jgi:hypothetical protein